MTVHNGWIESRAFCGLELQFTARMHISDTAIGPNAETRPGYELAPEAICLASLAAEPLVIAQQD